LLSHCNEKVFKILFLDVGQQLLALKKPFEEPSLFYWQRETRGSAAEVDYLWQKGEQILPVEVKAGKTGTLKSLRLFLSEKNVVWNQIFSSSLIIYRLNIINTTLCH